MLNGLRLYITGIFILLQFFTILPIRRNFTVDKQQKRYVLYGYPVLGLLQGLLYAGFLFLLQSFTPFSDLMVALFLWLLLIVLSGGIHLDGWTDASDAYFSFKDPKKRLEIMQDPRVGAFGVLSVVVFLFVRFIVLYELIQMSTPAIYLLIMLVPFFGKALLGVFLQSMPLAKKEGMAAFFKQGKSKQLWWVYSFYIILTGAFISWLLSENLFVYLIFLLVFILAALLLARFIIKNFTGINGDTLGASSEGMEFVLWMTLWLLHSFAMV